MIILFIVVLVLLSIYFNLIAKKERINAELNREKDTLKERQLKVALDTYTKKISKTFRHI